MDGSERIANVTKITKKMTNLFVTLLEEAKVPVALNESEQQGDPMFRQKVSEFSGTVAASQIVNCCEMLLEETASLKTELMTHDFEHLSQGYQNKIKEKEKAVSERLRDKIRVWEGMLDCGVKELEKHYQGSTYHQTDHKKGQ